MRLREGQEIPQNDLSIPIDLNDTELFNAENFDVGEATLSDAEKAAHTGGCEAALSYAAL